MQYLPLPKIRDQIQTYGRTWYDETTQVLYANFTCGGFRIRFTGYCLAARFRAEPDTYTATVAPPTPGRPAQPDWPYIAIFLDGSQTPVQKLAVQDGDTVPLFFSEAPGTHEIQVLKLTENFRTCLGLEGVLTDGEILPTAPEGKPVVEFIGDSITCGFGNGTNDPAHSFCAAEEDGYMTHGAIAARALGMEPRFISVSGIAVDGETPPGCYTMRQLYRYTDRICQEKLATKAGEEAKLEPYDFSAKPANYVVLNLGTNDASQIYFSQDKLQATEAFRKNYAGFLREIRALNGANATILCALGCMDYYLFDEIRDIVAQYQAETGDKKVFLLKYNKMLFAGPDVGGCLHPSIFRQEKMAEELTAKIRELQSQGF